MPAPHKTTKNAPAFLRRQITRRSWVAIGIVVVGVCVLGATFALVRANSRWLSAPFYSASRRCGTFPPQTRGLARAADPQLRKLAQYEVVCGSKPEARSALFMPTPTTKAQAHDYAAATATTLKEYAHYGIAPLVFLEPADASGNILNLSTYAAGSYDEALAEYFAQLKQAGLRGDTMGLWVLLPEGNIPEWSSVNPAVYTAVVARTARALKQTFPSVQASILLDSRTYQTVSYQNPQYVSWLPYVRGIPAGLVDSVGLQAYPDATTTNPQTYLRTDFLLEAARHLGVHRVWVSTGTYASLQSPDTGELIRSNFSNRQTSLQRTVDIMRQVKAAGFETSIMLFAADKSQTAEKTDWSYWPATEPKGAGVEAVREFIQKLQTRGLQFWLYDSYEG